MMKKLTIYIGVCCLLFCMACSEDNKIGEVAPLRLEYDLPQGESPADDRILEHYKQYGGYILYKYTEQDLQYDAGIGSNYVAEPGDVRYVGGMLDMLDDIWFDFYPEKFRQETIPYQIFLAKKLQNVTKDWGGNKTYSDKAACTGAYSVVLGLCSDTLQKITPEVKLELKNILQANLWSQWLTYGYIEVTEEFYEVSSYVGVAVRDVNSPDYSRARGFVENYGENRYHWYESYLDYSKKTLDRTADLSAFIESMVTRSSEDWKEDLEWPLVKKKYDILRDYFLTKYELDLRKIGDKIYE